MFNISIIFSTCYLFKQVGNIYQNKLQCLAIKKDDCYIRIFKLFLKPQKLKQQLMPQKLVQVLFKQLISLKVLYIFTPVSCSKYLSRFESQVSLRSNEKQIF